MLAENINATYILLMILAVLLSYVLYHNYWITQTLYFCTSELVGSFIPALIFGSAKNKIGSINTLLRLCKYLHPLGKIWFGCGLHVISDPETVELLLKKHLAKGQMYEFVKPYIGNTMLVAPVYIWKKHRKILSQAFNKNILNSNLESFTRHSHTIIGNLHSCQNVQMDIYPEFFRYFVEIVCEFALSKDLSIPIDQQNELMVLVQRGQTILGKRIRNPLFQNDLFWKLLGGVKKEQYLFTRVIQYASKIVEKFEANKTSVDSQNFLNLMLTARDEQDLWSREEVVNEMVVFFMAGSETSAITSTFVMLMLALHEDVQKKVFQELFQIFGNSNRDVVIEDLEKMKYLGQVINETLRLFPPGPVILRKIEEDVTLGHHTFRSGTNFLIPIIFMHRNPLHWPDPLKFDPERFLPEEVSKRPRCAFMPFSISPRNCIGMKFAEMSMKTVLSSVLRNFEVHTKQYNYVENINLNMHFILTPPDGCKVTLVSRVK